MSGAYSRRLANLLRRACPPAVRAKLSRVLRLRTGIAFRLVVRAQILSTARQPEKAIRSARMALRFQPGLVPAYEVLIQLLTQVGRYGQALDVCARAFEANVHSEGLIFSLRNILPQVRRSYHPENMVRSLSRCLIASPQQIDVLRTLLEILSSAGRYREAVLTCDRLLEIDPDLMAVAQAREKIFNDPLARPSLHGLPAVREMQRSDEYDKLVAHNVAGLLIEVMTKFYRDLGADVSEVPLIRALNSFCRKMPVVDIASSQNSSSPLIQFERAWARHQEGQIGEALRLFETVFRDGSARKRMMGNPFIAEAVVRSGEILGRRQEKIGNTDAAIAIYREIMELDGGNGVIARRLLLLLSRSGNLHEAAKLAQAAIHNRTNLYPQLIDNPYIAALKKDLSAAS
jgi:tetratricopeptide (TPR) repeat protein